MRLFLLAGLSLGTIIAANSAGAFTAPTTPNAPAPETNSVPPAPPMPKITMVRRMMPSTRAEVVTQSRETFAALDKNKDGFLTRDELPSMPPMAMAQPPRPPMPPKGPDAPGPDGLFAMMDTNHDGQISKGEFDAFHKAGNVQRTLQVTRDKDGHETRSERVMIVRRGEGAPPAGMPDMPGMAGHPMPPMPPMAMGPMRGMGLAMRFDEIDANYDGKLSAQEVEANALARFDKLDTDHDGTLSAEEKQSGATRLAIRIRDGRVEHIERSGPGAPTRGPGYDLPATPPAPPGTI